MTTPITDINKLVLGTILVYRNHTNKEKYFRLTKVYYDNYKKDFCSDFEAAYSLESEWIKSNWNCPLKNWNEGCDVYSQPTEFKKIEKNSDIQIGTILGLLKYENISMPSLHKITKIEDSGTVIHFVSTNDFVIMAECIKTLCEMPEIYVIFIHNQKIL